MIMIGRRARMPLTLVLLLSALPAAAQVRTAVGGGPCSEGQPAMGTLGINYLLCVGGSCQVYLKTGKGITHDFSTEPRIETIAPNSPAAGKLRQGDVITAIDGVLITTREGGRRLANLKPGVPVLLSIRRDGVEMEVNLVPRLDCARTKLAVLAEE
jgi:S1-C subfamily serine protease